MKIKKYDLNNFHQRYGILCRQLFPFDSESKTPFGGMQGIIEPGHTSKLHNHHETEVFLIIEGIGVIQSGKEKADVSQGDLIQISPISNHSLTNTSTTNCLMFLTIWWEDIQLLDKTLRDNHSSEQRSHKIIVTATPPTPNGDLHLGHLSGPYLAADIYSRYLKLKRQETYYVTGSDDNQSYVPLKASQIGLSSRQTADKYSDMMASTLAAANIHPDIFARPNRSRYHKRLAEEFFIKLFNAGDIVVKDTPSLFCNPCNKYLFEAYVRGNCPHCGSPSDGNACEQCGRPNDCTNLNNPICKSCGNSPDSRMIKRLYFRLGHYAQQLKAYHESIYMGAHLKSLCEKMLADGLPDIAVSHVSDWGIPVPIAGFEDQKIYVWFEMAPGYLAASQELSTDLAWSDDTKVVQFFGFDNGYFHSLLFPAIFMAYGKDLKLPDVFVTNEFYRLDGLKFSTSRNHAIWGCDFLKDVSSDIARFYLSYSRPETAQTNFTMDDFKYTIRKELGDAWVPWLQELWSKINDEFEGVVPFTGAWSNDHLTFFKQLGFIVSEVENAYEAETFSTQKVTRTLCELVRITSRFANSDDHLRLINNCSDERRTGIALELLAAKFLAILVSPIMPEFSARLWLDLGMVDEMRWESEISFVPGNQSISKMQSAVLV